MSQAPDVLVVGGGIIGLCAALAAADRRLRVTVADDARPGAASRASAGMLGPSLHGLPSSTQELAFAARDFYPEFLAGLGERSGATIGLDRSGILEIATSESDLGLLAGRAAADARVLQQHELTELEPALASHPGAVHHPLDGWVDNRALMEAMWIAVARHPLIETCHARVASIDLSGAHARCRLAGGAHVDSERILLATGAWAGLPGLPKVVPVRPVKGELLTLDRAVVRHVVSRSGTYAVPRGDTLLIGATSEEAVFDPGTTARGRRWLRRAASALIPELRHARVADHWGGLRPCSPDGLPLLGENPERPALVYACGFSRNGILLGPWAGDALGELFSGAGQSGIPREFHPARFEKIVTAHGCLTG